MNDVVRHPIRGFFWGLLFGIGLYFLLVGFKVFVLGEWGPVIISLVIGVVLNVAWAMFAPPKGAKPPKGGVPLPVEPLPAAAAATTMAGLPPEPPAEPFAPEPPPPPPPPPAG